jgi:nucleotide-binding universal stress UspA family protein
MPAATAKFVCPVDFSEGSEHALDKAVEFARTLHAQIELVHVYQVPVLAMPDIAMAAMDLELTTEVTKQSRKLLEDTLLRLRAQAPDLQVNAHLLQGMPADSIVNFAQETGASMIVIGTHGRRGFQRFLLGSVAERVVRISHIPVLTVQASSKDA